MKKTAKPKTSVPKPRPLTRAKIRANRKKGIAALRSGKYKQGRGALVRCEGDARRFCCLGVACEAVIGYRNSSGNIALSASGRAALGIDSHQQVGLMGLNDEEKRRFTTIAKAIAAMPIVYPEGAK